ncbi:LOW QUALITY PROTEIN: dentin sialophosphoprotein [Adelges cooleyi]|uniref:LOW QUALITY PROTEIN: dentin sialophosphoprotein n=1 Tax=Adelges cooleyi TaxID=133065 RepID=UPI00217FA233|nr:LOW QUALITY PROTEIN: dentin sialophosphoprotein [Adelges cooleyi]
MRLSVVFELLLIFLIIAFAAYGRVVPENKDVWRTSLNSVKEHLKHMGQARQAASAPAPPNRYCACSNLMCNCCRDFSLPVVPIQGPGCASLKYLKGDQMAVTMSFGDKVLRNTTISGRKPKPVCMNLPGGISKFCGRVYGISRDGDQFKACLGLELRALDDVEAALRVSCFRFGPQGMKVEPAQPLPATASLQGEDEDDEDEDDDDDDDDDDYGLGDGEEEEEDDDDAAEEESENDVESSGSDYTGFSALSTDFLDSLFGGGGAAATEEEDAAAAAAETVKPSTAKPATAPYKTKATTPSPTSQLTEKQASAESVTSTSYTVSVVQDNTAASAEASTVTALDDTPTDRVETVPTPSQSAASTSATDTKDKDYDDDDDDDDDDDNDDDEDGDIVSDIIESAADVVGMSDAKKNSTGTTKAAAAVTEAATSPTTSDAAVAATTNNAPSGKDTEDDDDESEEDDDDDDDEDDKFKRSFGQQQQLMPVAIVPNDRRGRTHRRMRLSVADADETAIHFMKKV